MTQTPINILFIVHALNAGGISAVVNKLSAEYDSQGHKVTVLSTSKYEQNALQTQDTKIHTFPLPKGGMFSFLCTLFFLIPFFIKNRDFDIIFIPSVVNAIVTLPILRLLFKTPPKTLVNAHTAFSHYYKSQGFIKKRILDMARFILPIADIIANDSKGAARDLKQHFKLKKDVHVLYNPISNAEDLSYTAPTKDAPHKWLRDDTLTTFVSCGRFVKMKNFSHMIRVFAKLYASNKNARLILIGKGEEIEKLQNLARTLSLENVIDFVGYVDSPKAFFYHADYFWLTSTFEGFSIVLGEALSMGTPCIAHDCPYGPREVLQDGKYGLLIEEFDVEKNTLEIEKFLNIPPKDKAFYRSRARNFLVSEVAQNYLDTLQTHD